MENIGSIVSLKLMILLVYIVLGVIFSLVFLWRGLTRVDMNTAESGWFFKALIFPRDAYFLAGVFTKMDEKN